MWNCEPGISNPCIVNHPWLYWPSTYFLHGLKSSSCLLVFLHCVQCITLKENLSPGPNYIDLQNKQIALSIECLQGDCLSKLDWFQDNGFNFFTSNIFSSFISNQKGEWTTAYDSAKRVQKALTDGLWVYPMFSLETSVDFCTQSSNESPIYLTQHL